MAEQLVRTTTGGKAHLPRCSHVLGKPLVPIPPAADVEVCALCQAELDGVGRVYFDTLDEALAGLGLSQLLHERVWCVLSATRWDAQYVPQSRSYVALTASDRTVAWVGKGCVDWPDGQKVELPGYRSGSGGGSPREETWGAVCPTCHQARSLSGACDCD